MVEFRFTVQPLMSLRDGFDDPSMLLADLLFEYDLLGVDQNPNLRPDDDEEYDGLVSIVRDGLETRLSPSGLSEESDLVLRSQ